MKMCVRRIIFHHACNDEIKIHSLSRVDEDLSYRIFARKIFFGSRFVYDHFARVFKDLDWLTALDEVKTEDVGIRRIDPIKVRFFEEQIFLLIPDRSGESKLRKTSRCFYFWTYLTQGLNPQARQTCIGLIDA